MKPPQTKTTGHKYPFSPAGFKSRLASPSSDPEEDSGPMTFMQQQKHMKE